MSKKHKIIFNLTIDDLKELGIIGKKKRRRRNKKYKNVITDNNIKSSSDHMAGYSNVFNNSSNLQTENMQLQNENLKLQNNQIENINPKLLELQNNFNMSNNRLLQIENQYPRLQALENGFTTANDKLMQIQNGLDFNTFQTEQNKKLSQFILQNAYAGEFSRPFQQMTGIRGSSADDNIDVATTGGDNTFNSQENAQYKTIDAFYPEPQILPPPPELIPQKSMFQSAMKAIRKPFQSTDKKIIAVDKDIIEEPPPADILDEEAPQTVVVKKGSKKASKKSSKIVPPTNLLNDFDQDSTPLQLQGEFVLNSEPEPEPEIKQSAYQIRKAELAQLKHEYTKLGGSNLYILDSNSKKQIKRGIENEKLKAQYINLGGNDNNVLNTISNEAVANAIEEIKQKKLFEEQQKQKKKKAAKPTTITTKKSKTKKNK